ALPVAALVERDDVAAVREAGRDSVEPVRVRGAAVKEEDAGGGRCTPFEGVKLEVTNVDALASRGLAGEGTAHEGHLTLAAPPPVRIAGRLDHLARRPSPSA